MSGHVLGAVILGGRTAGQCLADGVSPSVVFSLLIPVIDAKRAKDQSAREWLASGEGNG